MALDLSVQHQDQSLQSELQAFELDRQALVKAIYRAFAAAVNEPSTAPATFPGQVMWGRLVSSLTEELGPQGWVSEPEQNSPHFFSPSRKFCLLILSGDEKTGKNNQTASNRYPKGPVFQKACLKNHPDMFGLEPSLHEQLDAGEIEYIVLMHYTDKSDRDNPRIYSEVSKPISFTKGFVTGWEKQIMLPEISINSFQDEFNTTDEPQDTIDIEVSRKKKT